MKSSPESNPGNHSTAVGGESGWLPATQSAPPRPTPAPNIRIDFAEVSFSVKITHFMLGTAASDSLTV